MSPSGKRLACHAGKAGAATLIAATSLVAVAVLLWLLLPRRQAAAPRQTLLVYCAAGVKPPVEAVARAYEKECGVSVQLQYGGSGTLLSNLRIARAGDLFVAGDASFVRLGREQGVIAEAIPLAQMHPVIAVRAGNPKRIQGLDDLLRGDVAVALASPGAASIGRLTQQLLEPSGLWALLKPRVKVFKPTVNDIANDIKLGGVDAGIVWDATARQYPELQAVEVPSFASAVETVTIGVLTASARPAAALRFARYLSAPDRGAIVFAQNRYTPAAGDAWAETPELVLFSGAMLRPGMEKTLREFETREGVRFTTVYNGCGILCAQMRAGERPDAYFSCETSFMNNVADLYLDPVNVVDNDLMLIVARGNPLNIRTPEDLLRPGLRVGLPHHEKSAMGNIAWKLLTALRLYDRIGANLKVESPTGDFLVNQLRTGSLDVILACRSNLTGVREHLDGVPIQHPLAHMTQPYAIGKESRYPHLLLRLREAMVSAGSRQRFEAAGFGWQYAPAPAP
ncbi:MAG: substrate-binding domain-containing protein [bacterium]